MRFLYRIFISGLAFLLTYHALLAAAPDLECGALPGCDGSVESETSLFRVLGNVIAELIKYVAVIAVLAVMFGGIMYLISSGEEEKTKKAKNIIIWALVGVLLSVAAMGIINIINNFRI